MTDDATKDKDPFRIAPELEEEIEADAMNQQAEYAFIEKMVPREENNELVEVTFKLPYGGQNFIRTFARDPVSSKYDVPSLSQLYDLADGADLSNPKSILEASIPIEADDGYSLSVPPKQKQPKEINRTEADKEVEEIDLYPIRTTPLKEYVIPSALALLGVIFAISIGGISGVLSLLIFGGAGAVAYLNEQAYKPPTGARRVDDNETIVANRKDILILDKQSIVLSKEQRTVVEVTGKDGNIIVADVVSGDTTVRIDPDRLRVQGPVGSDTYQRAYVIDRSSGEVIRTT